MSTLDLTLDPRPVRRLEVISGDIGRRTWTAEQKDLILALELHRAAARRRGLKTRLTASWPLSSKKLPDANPACEEMAGFVRLINILQKRRRRIGHSDSHTK